MNYRLEKYNLKLFDYSKLNNKSYIKRYYGRLIANYMYNTSGLESFIKTLKKYSDRNFFNHLEIHFPEILKEIELKFNTSITDKIDRLRIVDMKYIKNTCKECGNTTSETNTFCSVKCSNINKSKDDNFKEILSNSLKAYYVNNIDQTQRHNKIQKTIIESYDNMTDEDKRLKCTNNIINYTAYDNFETLYPKLKLKCTSEYFYSNKHITVECKDCNSIWEITKSTTYNKTECKKCNPYIKHKQQNEIATFIKSKGFKVLEDTKKFIYPQELDIVVNGLAIEFNGLLYHSEAKEIFYENTHKNYHLEKTEKVEEIGLELFHIFENEWIDKNLQNIWRSKINSKLGLSNRIYARKCEISEINPKEAKEFIQRTHLQGYNDSSIKIGLFYNNNLVSAMTFGKPRINKWKGESHYEIFRFSSELNLTIVGGASKLLKYFERNYKPKLLLSYANRRWSQGNVYERLGFNFEGNTKPNFFYFMKNVNILYSRNRFQKHKLKDILEKYDENLSGRENMIENDYRIIYDSGNKVYVKKY
jgi:hypothetical protein